MNRYGIITMFMFFALIIAPFASAGTLISGSNMDVKSNYQGLNGLSLVGTYSTTPTVNDRVSITNLVVPDPYEIKSSADITFNQPKFEQVFDINNQQRVLNAEVVDKTIYFTPSTSDSACENAWNKYRTETELNKELYPNFDPIQVSGNKLLGYCRVIWVTTSQTGFIGKITDDRIFFSQDIVVSGVGTMHLERSDKMDSLVATIPGVARAALVDFGMYTNAKLTDGNIYAFQTKTAAGAGAWRPFSNVAVVTSYQQADQALQALDDQFYTQSISADVFANNVKSARANLNTAAANLNTQSQTLPIEWNNKIVGAPRVDSANLIIVEPKRDTLTANIQIAVRGDKFGLFIPTGVCTINTIDTKEQWLETGQGQLAYSVKNTGTDDASLRLSATCAGGNVNAVPQDFALSAGATKTGNLVLTGRTSTLQITQSFACTFTCLEKNTQQQDTEAFTAVLERKQLCSEGEQSDPKLVGTSFVVDVFDANCAVKTSISCDALTKSFVKENGIWTCKDKASGGLGGIGQGEASCSAGKVRDSTTGECVDQTRFNPTALIIALVLALIGGGAAYAYTGALSHVSKKYGTLLRVIVAILVFIALLFAVAALVNGIVSLFSFATG